MFSVIAGDKAEKVGPTAGGFVDLPSRQMELPLMVSVFPMKARATFEGKE